MTDDYRNGLMDGYALAALLSLGDQPQDEYIAYKVVRKLAHDAYMAGDQDAIRKLVDAYDEQEA